MQKILNFDIEYSFTSFLLPVLISYYISGVYLSKIELTEKNRNIAFLCFIIPVAKAPAALLYNQHFANILF